MVELGHFYFGSTGFPFCVVSGFDYAILFEIRTGPIIKRMVKMPENRRADPRFAYFLNRCLIAASEVSVNGCVAGNISLSGISLRVQGFVPVGTVLELQIRLGKSPKVIWAKAQVVRIRQVLAEDCYEIGLKFIRDEECIKAVGAYITCLPSLDQLKNVT